ncbi:MAG: effector-associated constant component EACC1 [Pseudonocardiaceae bacterium]
MVGHDELRGRVQPVAKAPQPGTMGSVTEVLVTVGQGVRP